MSKIPYSTDTTGEMPKKLKSPKKNCRMCRGSGKMRARTGVVDADGEFIYTEKDCPCSFRKTDRHMRSV